MKTPLLPIQILSVYKSPDGQRVFVPRRMAQCTPDMYMAIFNIKAEVEALGGKLILSDLFRSYDMQLQAHLDYTSGKKASFSPAPGGSLHEAGRSFDMDLSAIKIPLDKFWSIAAAHGVTPIIKEPKSSLKEAWHFDCRGSHAKVYDYYAAGKGTNLLPYQAMAASAILSLGFKHDKFQTHEREAAIQCLLIRLGNEIGNIDGQLGMKSLSALEKAGLPSKDLDAALIGLENMAQSAFPNEYRMNQPVASSAPVPDHLIS